MIQIKWKQPQIRVLCEEENIDAAVRTELGLDGLSVFLHAQKSRPTPTGLQTRRRSPTITWMKPRRSF